jgi:hypothetical protein
MQMCNNIITMHPASMRDRRNAYKVLVRKHEEIGPLGRTKPR